MRFPSSIAVALAAAGVTSWLAAPAAQSPATTPPVAGAELSRMFVYETAPFPSAHASTIVETPTGLVAAWFGGTHEKHPDVGIWVSRLEAGRWTTPVEVATGVQPDGKRHPTWNPVLFQMPKGPLVLFYKVGPSPSTWWGRLRTSTDGGRTWSESRALPEGILGPIRAKPVLLADGTLLAGSSTEHDGWKVHMERTRDPLGAWEKTGPLNDGKQWSAIQPTILDHGNGRLQILCRSEQGVVSQAWSEDGGRTWSAMTGTTLPNPSAGIDVVKLADGRFLLIYNPLAKGRHQLRLAHSRDGKSWTPSLMLEDQPGEYSYPAIIQTADGKVHATYTWKRTRIRHVVIDPAKLP
jgi:predicted neuraminidase